MFHFLCGIVPCTKYIFSLLCPLFQTEQNIHTEIDTGHKRARDQTKQRNNCKEPRMNGTRSLSHWHGLRTFRSDINESCATESSQTNWINAKIINGHHSSLQTVEFTPFPQNFHISVQIFFHMGRTWGHCDKMTRITVWKHIVRVFIIIQVTNLCSKLNFKLNDISFHFTHFCPLIRKRCWSL